MLQLPDTEQPLWHSTYTIPLYPALAEDIEVDAVIVGAGITGLTSAYLLKRAGLRVAVLEKSAVGAGTSGRTTGKVTSQHELTYEDLKQRLGEKTAKAYGDANQQALKQISDIIKHEKITCDWQRDDNYVFTSDARKVEQFKREAKTAAALGLPASFETTTPLPFTVKGAVRFANQAKINSQEYLLGLARQVHGSGSFVFEQSKAIAFKDGNPAYVQTPKGKVTAQHIIVATNVPTSLLLARGGYCILEYPTESFAIAGPLAPDWAGMYISPDKDHHSILPTSVQGKPVLLVVGAGGNVAGFRLSKQRRYRQLADYAERLGLQEVTHCWSDRDYMAYDRVPLVGKLYPWSKHIYVGTAFRKWGLTNGTVAAMILRDTILDGKSKWSSTFTTGRLKPVLSIPYAVGKHVSG